MSRLSDVIGRVVELETDPLGNLDIHRAVAVARPMLDGDDIEMLLAEALAKRIKDATTRERKQIEGLDNDQADLPFPDLRRAHAIDTEGRFVVLTDSMSEMQFRRVIEIRRKQLKHDRAYLDVLEQAFRQVEPIWTEHPDFTFGEVCRLLIVKAAA